MLGRGRPRAETFPLRGGGMLGRGRLRAETLRAAPLWTPALGTGSLVHGAIIEHGFGRVKGMVTRTLFVPGLEGSEVTVTNGQPQRHRA